MEANDIFCAWPKNVCHLHASNTAPVTSTYSSTSGRLFDGTFCQPTLTDNIHRERDLDVKKERVHPHFAGAFTVDEAASYLRISRAGLYRLLREGSLKPARVGGRTLLRKVDLEAFLARCVESA